MKLYFFNDAKYQIGELINPGSFGSFIKKQSLIAQKFEKIMEKKRKKICPDKPSRLNCVFALNKKYADGFNSKRRYLYELDMSDNTKYSVHNYNIITYFSKLFSYCNVDQIMIDEQLMEDYWTCPEIYKTWENEVIGFIPEYLISDRVKILRVIKLK